MQQKKKKILKKKNEEEEEEERPDDDGRERKNLLLKICCASLGRRRRRRQKTSTKTTTNHMSNSNTASNSSGLYPPPSEGMPGRRRRSNNNTNNGALRIQVLGGAPFLFDEAQLPFALGFLSAMALRFITKTVNRGYDLPPKQIGVTDKFGKKKSIRRLEPTDYDKGFVDLLKQLTVAPKMSKKKFVKRWHQMRDGPEFCYVLENDAKTKIIATATLVVERKFGRNLGLSGHVEDVVVDENFRDSGLGKVMIDAMSIISRNHVKCYKTILDCSADNVQFYEKCGFGAKEIQMAKYYTDDRGYGNSYAYENENNKSSSNKRDGIMKLNNGDKNKNNENNGSSSSTSERKKSARRRVTYAAGTDDGFVGSPVKALNQTVYYSDED